MIKPIIAIWMLVYLAVSTGVMVNYHFCMNRLASTQFYAEASKTCPKCGMHIDVSHGCCRDEVKIVKMENDQPLTHWVEWRIASPELAVPLWAEYTHDLSGDNAEQLLATDTSPPPLHRQDTYLHNCVFRI